MIDINIKDGIYWHGRQTMVEYFKKLKLVSIKKEDDLQKIQNIHETILALQEMAELKRKEGGSRTITFTEEFFGNVKII
jgi:hypothetical protein